jgi:cell division protease FtsH
MAGKRKLPKGKKPSQRDNRPASLRPERLAPNDIRCIAVHEAGHAVAAVVYGLTLHGVDIRRRRLPNGMVSMGFTQCPIDARDFAGKGEAAAMPHAVQVLAGPLAEVAFSPGYFHTAGSDAHDREAAWMIATIAVCEPVHRDDRIGIAPGERERNRDRIDKFMEDACEEARNFVNSNTRTILGVATALLERKSLTGEEVAAIVKTAQSRIPG